MRNVSFKDRVRKKLGMKTREEKVDDGLRAMRDLLEKMGCHDIAIPVEQMMFNGSMTGKCIMLLSMTKVVPLLMVVNKLKEIGDDLKKQR